MIKTRVRREKWAVYGEYGGRFTNLKDAKACARQASRYEADRESEVRLEDNGCYYFKYEDGKLVYDGWTIKK